MIMPRTPVLYEGASKNRNSSGCKLVLGERLEAMLEDTSTIVLGERQEDYV